MNNDANSSKASVSFPTFNDPGSGAVLGSEQTGSKPEVYDLGNHGTSSPADRKDGPGERTSDSVNDEEGEWGSKGDLADSDIAKEEYVIDEMESPSRPRSRAFSGRSYRRSRPPPPNLAPAIWRIILFQM